MRVFLFLLLFIGQLSWAVSIPKQLSLSDRRQVTRMLGIATSTKLLTNPFPLGGYSGFEIGLTVELIDIGELAKLGCAVGSPGCPNDGLGEREMRFTRITMGKGLYNNVDLFLHFAPLSSSSEFTSFGGAIRYSFYEAKFLPLNLSLVFSADHINVNDDFENLNFSTDLIAGMYVDLFSLYVGVGQVQANSSFIGGSSQDGTVDPSDPNLSPTSNKVTQSVNQVHSLFGITVHLDDLFAAAQIDRYPDTTYSGRVGIRF